ncbi:MAG: folate family ECF transporter S component [Oscillospiraceae bacterium]|jgi:ECF transporter S component (folate family)
MRLYAGPWQKGYWQEAAKALKSLRVLVFVAVLVGLEIILSMLVIPVGGNALQIHFTFLVIGLSNLVGGPFMALLSGCAADLLSFFIFPPGAPFFPGYTLTAMLSAFIYALFLFRAPISVARIFLCKLVINVGVNVLLGSIWRTALYGKGYFFYVGTSLVKNTILLPVEVIILLLVFSLLLKPLAHTGLIPPQPTKQIPLLFLNQRWKRESS